MDILSCSHSRIRNFAHFEVTHSSCSTDCKLIVGGPDKGLWDKVVRRVNLSTLSADAAGELDVFRHDGDTLGVNGAQVGVLEEPNQVGFGRLLQGHNSG